MPLSSFNNRSNQSKHDRSATGFWRPDIDPDDSRGVVTTVGTSRDRRNSSQEDLNPKQSWAPGVNIHKSFQVTSNEV